MTIESEIADLKDANNALTDAATALINSVPTDAATAAAVAAQQTINAAQTALDAKVTAASGSASAAAQSAQAAGTLGNITAGGALVPAPAWGSVRAISNNSPGAVDPINAQTQALLNLIAYLPRPVASIPDLLAVVPSTSPRTHVLGYYVKGDAEPGFFEWSASTAKSQHDGGRVISPTVPWTLVGVNFLNGVGETQPAGSGCWVRMDKEVRTSHFGVTDTSTPVWNKRACQRAVATARDVFFDQRTIDLGTINGAELLFPLTPAHTRTTLRGPTRLVYDGPTTTNAALFAPAGVEDMTVADVHGEDRLNKSATMVGQTGVDYILSTDPATGPRGCQRLTFLRPAAYGGRSLFTAGGTVNGTKADGVVLEDAYVEDTYYGINCAESGDNLRANLHSRRVKRAYFSYEVSGHNVDVLSEDPALSNAHFLLKSYKPKGLRNINARLTVRGDGTGAKGRLAFELQDEANDDALIENVNVEFNDERTGDSDASVVVRAWASPVISRTTTNSRMQNITVTGRCLPILFDVRMLKIATVRWEALSRTAKAINLFEYNTMYGLPHNEVFFLNGSSEFVVALQGVAGVGIDYTLPIADLLMGAANVGSATLKMHYTAYQGDPANMANHTTSEQDILFRKTSPTNCTAKLSDLRNKMSTGAFDVLPDVSVAATGLRIQQAALGGGQYLVVRITVC